MFEQFRGGWSVLWFYLQTTNGEVLERGVGEIREGRRLCRLSDLQGGRKGGVGGWEISYLDENIGRHRI